MQIINMQKLLKYIFPNNYSTKWDSQYFQETNFFPS